MDEKPPQIMLTIFLIKESETTVDSFLRNNGSLACYTLKDGQKIIGYLCVKYHLCVDIMMIHHMIKKCDIKIQQRFDFPNVRLFQRGPSIQLTF